MVSTKLEYFLEIIQIVPLVGYHRRIGATSLEVSDKEALLLPSVCPPSPLHHYLGLMLNKFVKLRKLI